MTTTAKKQDLYKLAEKCYEEAGSAEEAVALLRERINGSQELLEQIIDIAIKEAIHRVQSWARNIVVKDSTNQPKRYSRAFQDSVQFSVGSYFNFPLMDGTRLGVASRDHLLSDATRYRTNAKGNLCKAIFLESVAAKLDNDKRVEEVWTEAQLDKLMRKAERQVAV